MLLLVGCGASSPPPQTPGPVVATPAMADRAARSLATDIDPSRGLVVVAHVEQPGEGDTPPRFVTGHRCVRTEIDETAAELARYFAQRGEMDAPGWDCRGDTCELHGFMEYDPTRALRFGRASDGRLVTVSLCLFDEPGVPEANVTAFRAQCRREAEALEGACR